jgi:SAM-dependent methyltransferase
VSGPTESLGYCKVCVLEDFLDPDLTAIVGEAFATLSTGTRFPAGQESRKYWEVAQSIRGLRDFGAIHEEAELLGVGAGIEQTGFWLTNSARRVFMTDLYAAEESGWELTTPRRMLVDPAPYAHCRWSPQRLVVQHMDALDLHYEDGSFDGLFSSSSIEHFGGPHEIATAAREMARVLKPGGIATIATEFRLDGPPPGLPGVRLFSEDDLHELIIDVADWELVEALSSETSSATLSTIVDFTEALEDSAAGRGWRIYPHLVLRHGLHLWTSVSLVLRRLPG